MINYIFYNNKTGVILSIHKNHPFQDPLTKERQEEMLKMLFGDSSEYYDVSMLVSKGYNEVFFADVIDKNIVNLEKLKTLQSTG